MILSLLCWLCGSPAMAGEPVLVKGGDLERFYPVEGEPRTVAVPGFRMDAVPVSNADYLRFVTAHPEWRRAQVVRLFADERYLYLWPSDLDVGGMDRKPVVHVSWFAARAYCEAQGGQLPTEVQWELAGQANETSVDARDDADRTAKLLAWYGRPSTAPLADVGSGTANVHGVHDLHALVWEWVEDFNSSFAAEDSRGNNDPDVLRFCGSGAVSAADATDYASFMRLAFRSSLKGAYTARSLGFRCAYPLESP